MILISELFVSVSDVCSFYWSIHSALVLQVLGIWGCILLIISEKLFVGIH